MSALANAPTRDRGMMTAPDPLAGPVSLAQLRCLLLAAVRDELPTEVMDRATGRAVDRSDRRTPSDPLDDWMGGDAIGWSERIPMGPTDSSADDALVTDDAFVLEGAGQLRLVLEEDDALVNALAPDGMVDAGTAATGSTSTLPFPALLARPVEADEAMAATLLASGFHRRLPLLRSLRAGRDARGVPTVGSDEIVLLRLGDMRLVGLVWRAVRSVVLNVADPLGEADLDARLPCVVPPQRMAVELERRRRSHARLDTKEDDGLIEALGRARAMGLPTVVVLPLEDHTLTERVRPLVDHEIELPDALGPAGTGATIDLMVATDPVLLNVRATVSEPTTASGPATREDGPPPDRPPRNHLTPVRGLADLVTLNDLRASVSARRGRRRSIARLRRVVRERFGDADVEAGATRRSRASSDAGTGTIGEGDAPRLEDLAGYGRAKQLGLEIAADLRGYAEGRVPWSEIDRGLVLCGPPGTGKTLFARALARSAGASFFAGSYSEWQRCGHLGDFLKAMDKTFKDARKAAPAVVLIDELDSFRRRAGGYENNDYLDQCVNALLQHLDGAIARDGVFVVGATNHAAQIDPAVVRSGRLERTIAVLPPDPTSMVELLRSLLGADLVRLVRGSDVDHSRAPDPDRRPAIDVDPITDGEPDMVSDGDADVDPSVDPDRLLLPLALRAAGASQADAAGWVRRARASARRANRPLVFDDLAEAVAEGRPELPPELRRRAAVHEAGHAVAALALGLGRVRSVYLTSGGGWTELTPAREAGTPGWVRRTLAFLLAGREAERLVLGDVSDGAGGGPTSDLARATTAAATAICAGGLGEGAPLWTLNGDIVDHAGAGVPAIPHDRVAEAATLLARAERDAAAIVTANRPAIERIADALNERHRLDEDAIEAMARGVAVWPGNDPT